MVRLPLPVVAWLEQEATAQHRKVAELIRHYILQQYETRVIVLEEFSQDM